MAKKSTIIKGETQTGIKYQIDTRIKDDARFLLYLTRIQANESTELEKGNALMSILKLFFGTDEGIEAFFSEVAAKHDGVADVTSLLNELNDIFDAMSAKNS